MSPFQQAFPSFCLFHILVPYLIAPSLRRIAVKLTGLWFLSGMFLEQPPRQGPGISPRRNQTATRKVVLAQQKQLEVISIPPTTPGPVIV
jgi:hypothetical protein